MKCEKCGRHKGHTLGCAVLRSQLKDQAAKKDAARLKELSDVTGVDVSDLPKCHPSLIELAEQIQQK